MPWAARSRELDLPMLNCLGASNDSHRDPLAPVSEDELNGVGNLPCARSLTR